MAALPTEEVFAFPFGEGVGFADGRGHCLPFRGRCWLRRRKRTLPSLSGKVSALPTEEVSAFPFGEGGGFADGRGLYGNKCSHLSEFIIFSPQSAKTFNDISVERDPLSALRATLPEGESFSSEREDFLSSTQSKRAGRLSII